MKKLFSHFKRSRIAASLLFVLLFSILCGIRFSSILEGIGSEKLIEAWSDGLKTYTNMMYHIDDADTDAEWFGGMNYPYGEHIVPATELAGMALLLKKIKPYCPQLSEYVPTLIHLELLLAFVLCGLFFFLLFRALHLPWWYSALIAIGLTFLNPLFPRMAGHFGLAQPFLFPALFYGLFRFEQNPNYWRSMAIGVLIFIASMLHFYFFGILVLVVSLYFLGRFLMIFFEKNEERFKTAFSYALSSLPHYFVMVGFNLCFFLAWMILPDPVMDRSATPWGFLVYISKWEGIFLWKENPFFEQWTGFIRETPAEGRAYIGVVATVAVLLFVLRACFVFFKKKSTAKRTKKIEISQYTNSINQFFKASLFASILLLIFSFGIPFIFEPFADWVEYIGPLRQFRSIGRFAWPFYFIVNVWAFHRLFFYVKNKASRGRMLCMVVAIFLLFFEAITFSAHQTISLKSLPYWTEKPTFEQIGLDFSEFQASIPAPYFSIGSNNFNQSPEGILVQRTGTLAAKHGLPTTGAMLTRSSFSQTYKQSQLLLQPYRKPMLLDDLKSDKDLLLIAYRDPKKSRFSPYRHLIQDAALFYTESVEPVEYYRLSLGGFEERIEEKKAKILQTLTQDTLFKIGDFLSTDSTQNFVFQDFEESPSERAYLSEGAKALPLNQRSVLFEGTVPAVHDTTEWYHMQTWVYIYEDGLPNSSIIFEEIGAEGKALQSFHFFLWHCVSALDTNGWALVDFAFRFQDVNSTVRFWVEGDQKDKRTQFFDSFLLKPSSTHLYQMENDILRKDNLYFFRQKQ